MVKTLIIRSFEVKLQLFPREMSKNSGAKLIFFRENIFSLKEGSLNASSEIPNYCNRDILKPETRRFNIWHRVTPFKKFFLDTN